MRPAQLARTCVRDRRRIANALSEIGCSMLKRMVRLRVHVLMEHKGDHTGDARKRALLDQFEHWLLPASIVLLGLALSFLWYVSSEWHVSRRASPQTQFATMNDLPSQPLQLRSAQHGLCTAEVTVESWRRTRPPFEITLRSRAKLDQGRMRPAARAADHRIGRRGPTPIAAIGRHGAPRRRRAQATLIRT